MACTDVSEGPFAYQPELRDLARPHAYKRQGHQRQIRTNSREIKEASDLNAPYSRNGQEGCGGGASPQQIARPVRPHLRLFWGA